MANKITNPRNLKDVKIALAWQDVEDTPAVVADVTHTVFADGFKLQPNITKLDPQGTHGSEFRSSEGRKVAVREPDAEISFFPTKDTLPFFLKSMTGKSYSNDVDLTKVLPNAETSNYRLVNVEILRNTDAARKVYLEVTGADTINVYSDSGRTVLIATGTATATGDLILAEVGDSHFTATVSVDTFPLANVAAGYDLTIDTMRFGWDCPIPHYFTMFFQDGRRKEEMNDCVVQKIEFTSEEKTTLMAVVTIFAKQHVIPSSAVIDLTATPRDKQVYAHKNLVVTDVSAVIDLAIRNMVFSIERPIEKFVGNNETPQKLIGDAFTLIVGSVVGRYSDELQTLVDRGQAEDLRNITAKWSLGGKLITADFNDVSWTGNNPFSFSDNAPDDFEEEFEAFTDGAVNPLEIRQDL